MSQVDTITRSFAIENGMTDSPEGKILPTLLDELATEFRRTSGERRDGVVGYVKTRMSDIMQGIEPEEVITRFDDGFRLLQQLGEMWEVSVGLSLATEQTSSSYKRRMVLSFPQGSTMYVESEVSDTKNSLTCSFGNSQSEGSPYARWSSNEDDRWGSKEEIETGWRTENEIGEAVYHPFLSNKRTVAEETEKKHVKKIIHAANTWFDSEFAAEILSNVEHYLKAGAAEFDVDGFFADADGTRLAPDAREILSRGTAGRVARRHPRQAVLLKDFPPVAVIKRELESMPVNWEQIEGSFPFSGTRRDQWSNPQRMADTIAFILGKLLEHHVDLVLENIHLRNLIPGLDINPPLEGKETEHFRFERRGGSIIAVDKETGGDYAEYDGLLEIQGIPVIVEVKGGKKKNTRSSMRNVGSRLAPLVEYYVDRLHEENKFVYIVVTPSSEINLKPGTIQRRFVDKGGELVRLPIKLDEMLEDGMRTATNIVQRS